MIRKIIKVSDNNFRKFDDPLGNETPRKYIFYAKTCDVPEGIPMSTNPRDQKLNSTVANAITESLLSNDGQFHLKNRGIIDKYNSAEHPTKAYSGKQAMLNEYLDDPEHYRKFVNVIPDLFDLYDAIETEFAVAYNENGRMYGRKSYSGYKEGSPVGKSKFCMSDIYYKIPDGLLYPILAAFRVLLEYDITSGKYKWMDGKDPIAVWNKHKVGLTRSVMDLAGSLGDKPTVFGKDPSLWNYAYMVLSSMEGISLV